MQPPRLQAPITPSASPAPASNSKSFFPAPYRIADEAPPLKRQRCSSTPRPPRASSSATPDDFNIGREREASALRMLDVWSQLAEKYSRRIDEDDIVDLVTGKIVKDRGVLSAETPWKIGRFADLDDSTGSDEEDEDDVDELDAFAGSAANEEVSVHGWTVPPVRKMDPADAKDLEDFMEAEKRRREECGEDEVNEEVSEDGGDLDGNQSQEADFDDETGDTGVSEGAHTPAAAASHRAEVDESDDELASWGVLDASNIVYLVDKTDDNQEIIEILDSPTLSPSRSLAHKSSTTTPKSTPHSHSKITLPKSEPNRKPPPRLQLQTPPQSRTPSSVLSSADEFYIPFPSPSSSLATPDSSSPTKPKPTTARRVDSPSQVRTRSQSRGGSSRPQDPLPKLDLADVSRGRSVRKSTPRARSVRSSAAKASESIDEPRASTSSTVVDHDSPKRSKSKGEASILSTGTNRRDATARSLLPSPSSPEPQSRTTLGKGKEKHVAGSASPRASNRKGKDRLIEAEDDRWREESGDPIGLSSSPTRPGRRESSPAESIGLRNKPLRKRSPQSHSTLKVAPEPLPRSTRKRKRKSLSSDSEDLNRSDVSIHDTQASSSFVTPPSSTRKNKTRSSSVSAKRSANTEEASHSDFDSEPESESARASSHRFQHLASTPRPAYYPPPGSFYPYPPPYAHDTDVHPAVPLQDPRAQFIISQAMHQLSSLFMAPWSAQPFTPPRRPPSARTASTSDSSPYYYPTTPHHPHAHPYVFDSGASMGTLPPSSPPGSSPPSVASSPLHGHGAGRRASLVPRSQSRGRRVSFKIDGELRDDDVDVPAGPSISAVPGRKTRTHEEPDDSGASPSPTKRKDKGKQKMVDANLSDSETYDVRSQPRTRLAERAQTPGPPIARADVQASDTVARGDTTTQRRSADHKTFKPKEKTRKTL